MSLTLAQGRDAIMGLLKGAVDAYNATHDPDVPVFWEDVEKAEQGARTAHMRAFVQFAEGGQETLGGVGSRRFMRAGVVIVQVMTPFGDGFTLADALGTVARNAFEGVSTPNGVWFRRVAVRSAGKTGGFQQTNVTANFEFTEQR